VSTQAPDDPDGSVITITRSDGWFVIRDEEAGITTQGETRAEAIENLADAIALQERDPEDDADPEPSDAPWF
jgi:predicted RNase H-like HicB family nuclease